MYLHCICNYNYNCTVHCIYTILRHQHPRTLELHYDKIPYAGHMSSILLKREFRFSKLWCNPHRNYGVSEFLVQPTESAPTLLQFQTLHSEPPPAITHYVPREESTQMPTLMDGGWLESPQQTSIHQPWRPFSFFRYPGLFSSADAEPKMSGQSLKRRAFDFSSGLVPRTDMTSHGS